MTTKLLIITAVLPFLFFNCAHLPVFQVNSLEKNKDFLMGRETVIKNNSSAKLFLNFERFEKNNFIFFIVIENISKDTLIVDPGRIYERLLEPQADTGNEIIYALNPESRILNIDKQINKTVAQKNTEDGIEFFISSLDLVSEIATIGQKKSAKEIRRRNHAREEQSERIHANEESFQQKMNSLYNEKDHWENSVLRITTLKPGDRIGGLIYLPVISSASIIKIVVPLRERKIDFLYKQTKL